MILGDIPVPGTDFLCRPVPQREKISGARSSLMTPVAVRLYARRTSDLAHTPDLHSIQLLLDMSPAPLASGTKIAGSPRIPYRCISLSFIVETGPEVLYRICEDIAVGGNSVQHRYFGLFSGAWTEAGIQATELLLAVHSFLGILSSLPFWFV